MSNIWENSHFGFLIKHIKSMLETAKTISFFVNNYTIQPVFPKNNVTTFKKTRACNSLFRI